MSISLNRNDGLLLNKTYITNILKCVPPEDRPLNEELNKAEEKYNLINQNLKEIQEKFSILRENKARSEATLEGIEKRKKDLIYSIKID